MLGPAPPGRALCFEDQYLSTGGQLYELLAGHDRFIADLRPLFAPVLAARGQAPGLTCHPYDICTLLLAEEAGVIVTAPHGGPLDVPLDVDHARRLGRLRERRDPSARRTRAATCARSSAPLTVRADPVYARGS